MNFSTCRFYISLNLRVDSCCKSRGIGRRLVALERCSVVCAEFNVNSGSSCGVGLIGPLNEEPVHVVAEVRVEGLGHFDCEEVCENIGRYIVSFGLISKALLFYGRS